MLKEKVSSLLSSSACRDHCMPRSTVMLIRQELSELFKNDSDPIPWIQVILTGLVALIPLLLGLAYADLRYAIYGSLTGYLLALNDPLGTLRHRLMVTWLTFFLLMSGFGLGFSLHGHSIFFQLCLAVGAYSVGLLGGEGGELERGLLFGTICLVIGYFGQVIGDATIDRLFMHAVVAVVTLCVAIPLLDVLRRRVPGPFLSLRQSFQRSLSPKLEHHFHAANFLLAVLGSFWVVQIFALERGYWVIVTVLLVMKPNRRESLKRTLQRLIGTALGMLVCSRLLTTNTQIALLLAAVTLSAALVPWALKRNYWVVAFFVTIFVVGLLEIAAGPQSDPRLPMIRLKATFIGCLICVLGTMVSKAVDLVRVRAVA